MVDASELRPAEYLKILDRKGREKFNRENSLAAALVYLSMNDYIMPDEDGEGFEPTDKDKSELREYEKELLDAVEGEDDPRDMVDAVYRFDFDKFFIENGFIEVEEVEKSMWVFDWTSNEEKATRKMGDAVNYLDKKQKEIEAEHDTDSFPDQLFVLSYAFPSQDYDEDFVGEAEEVVDDLHEAMNSSNTAAIAAATAASAASCSAAASSAAACGGAAGAAGGAGAC